MLDLPRKTGGLTRWAPDLPPECRAAIAATTSRIGQAWKQAVRNMLMSRPRMFKFGSRRIAIKDGDTSGFEREEMARSRGYWFGVGESSSQSF